MAKKPETLFKEKVKARLDKIEGIWFFKTQQLALLGIPDYIICYKGNFIAWELKKDEKSKPSKLQDFILNKIYEAGGLARIVHPLNFEYQLEQLLSLPSRSAQSP